MNQQKVWDKSYELNDNFVFYPNEEIIRFFTKYFKKLDFENFREVRKITNKNVLDLGCGIGRHIIYLDELGLEPFGIDISDVAITYSKKWAHFKKIDNIDKRIICGNTTNLPWDDKYFISIISHGVLDSMKFSEAKKTCSEVFRVLDNKGLFYCDLISGNDINHSRNIVRKYW